MKRRNFPNLIKTNHHHQSIAISLYTGQKRDLSGVFIMVSVGLKLLFDDVLRDRDPILGTRVSYSGHSEV